MDNFSFLTQDCKLHNKLELEMVITFSPTYVKYHLKIMDHLVKNIMLTSRLFPHVECELLAYFALVCKSASGKYALYGGFVVVKVVNAKSHHSSKAHWKNHKRHSTAAELAKALSWNVSK